MNKIWEKEYHGFEEIGDLVDEIEDGIREIIPNGHYTGTVKITLEYIPDPEEAEE